MIDVGSVLSDRYELRERIGVGGMGEVYRAFDRELEREVAIKSLLPHLARDEDLVGRFRREARTIARVRHPGIIALYDMLRLGDGALYLVLEFVPGRSLEAELYDGVLPWARCVDIGSQVCGALAAAHAQEVIHRDIKPSNILLEPSGVVRVADFGIARLAGASQVTRAGIAMGTPGFWAPEQALGEASSPQTDLYAVGAVLFQCSTGRMPFVAVEEGPAAALLNVTRPVPDPREARAGLPDAAAEIIMRAMAKDPADRWGSAVEMASALRATLGAPPVTPMEGFALPTPAPLPPTVATPAPLPPTVTTPPPVPPTVTPPPVPPTVATPPPVPPTVGPPETPPARAPEPEPQATVPPPAAEPAAERTRPARTRGLTRPQAQAPGRRLPSFLAVGGAVVVAALGGLAVSGGLGGDGETDPSPPAEAVRVRAGAGSLEVPGEWRSGAGGSLPGLPLDGAITARPADAAAAGRMVAGLSAATGPTLLPETFLARLDVPPEAGERVALGELGAYRHGDLRAEGLAAPATVFVVPTDDGVETVACVGADAGFQAACAGAATTLRMSGGARAFPLGPDADFADLLSRTLTTLGTRRATGRERLAGAERPAGQAAAAADLSAAVTAAAAALAGVDLGPEGSDLVEGVRAALRAQADGYGRMATGARTDARAAFAEGRRAVARGEQDLAQALEALRERGYALGA